MSPLWTAADAAAATGGRAITDWTVTGVSIMLLDEGTDTGPVVAQEQGESVPGDTAGALTARGIETERRTDQNVAFFREVEVWRPKSHWVRAADGHRVHLWSLVGSGSPRRRRPARRKVSSFRWSAGF